MATGLTRWDPFSELTSMRNAMDRLFDQRLTRFPAFRGEDLGPASVGLDVSEGKDSYLVKAALPGVDPSEVDISVEDDVLTIRGEFKHEQKEGGENENYLRRELQWGSFERSLRLPPTVDAEHAHAEFRHGMLELTLPKRTEAKSRSIKITPNESGAERTTSSDN